MPRTNIDIGHLITSTFCVHGNSNRLVKDLITEDYENIVKEELQHFLVVHFGKLVRKIRVVFNKVRVNGVIRSINYKHPNNNMNRTPNATHWHETKQIRISMFPIR